MRSLLLNYRSSSYLFMDAECWILDAGYWMLDAQSSITLFCWIFFNWHYKIQFLFVYSILQHLLHRKALQAEVIGCCIDQRLHGNQADNFAADDVDAVSAGFDTD